MRLIVIRRFLLCLIIILVTLFPGYSMTDGYQSPMMKAQYAYLSSNALALTIESMLRLCGQEDAADAIKPDTEEQMPHVMKAAKVYVAEGGRLDDTSDMVRFAEILSNSEAPLDLGYRLGITKGLETVGVSLEKYCVAALAEFKAAINDTENDASPPAK